MTWIEWVFALMLTDLEDAKSPVWKYIDGLHKRINEFEKCIKE